MLQNSIKISIHTGVKNFLQAKYLGDELADKSPHVLFLSLANTQQEPLGVPLQQVAGFKAELQDLHCTSGQNCCSPCPPAITLRCSQIRLLENTLLDWQNRTLRNDYRHAQPLNGRAVESSFPARPGPGNRASTQGSAFPQEGREVLQTSLGTLEITLLGGAVSVPGWWRWPRCLSA